MTDATPPADSTKPPGSPLPTEAEKVALGESGPLLRFAAEHVKNLDPDLARAIAESVEAQARGTWSAEVSQRFWTTFNKLCELIKPTTMDCLSASHRNLDPIHMFWFQSKAKVSLNQRTSAFCRWSLVLIIPIALLLQLYVWIGRIESDKMEERLGTLRPAEEFLTADYRFVDAKAPKDPPWPDDLSAKGNKLILDARALNREVQRLHFEASILQGPKLTNVQPLKIIPPDAKWYVAYQIAEDNYENATLASTKAQEQSALSEGIFVTFILPLLFGLIGAIAYVIRTISDEIATTTFSKTSPTRHLMRVALGAIAGVVVGFFTKVSTQVQLPQLAFAFLAGYGVEALFSMFDGIIKKFRPDSEGPTATRTTPKVVIQAG